MRVRVGAAEERLEPGRNACTAFVTLPLMLPTLAWRDLFGRASFDEGRPAPP